MAAGILFQQLHDMETKPALDNLWKRLANSHTLHNLRQPRINVLELLKRLEVQVTAGCCGCGIFRVIARDGGKVLAALNVTQQASCLRQSFFASLGIVLLSVLNLGFGDRRYQDMSDVIRLGKIKARLVLVEEGFDLGLGYWFLWRPGI